MSRLRSGVTLTEVIVALLLAGVAALALNTVLLADQRLRALATAEREGARAAREHLELLAARRCGADTGGTVRGPWGELRWSAHAEGRDWWLADSVHPARARHAVGLAATVRCAP